MRPVHCDFCGDVCLPADLTALKADGPRWAFSALDLNLHSPERAVGRHADICVECAPGIVADLVRVLDEHDRMRYDR